MNLKQIDRLVGAVPESIEEKSRRRLDGYAAVARRCEERIMALRDDEHVAYVAAWEHTGGVPELHREELEFQYVQPAQRSYK